MTVSGEAVVDAQRAPAEGFRLAREDARSKVLASSGQQVKSTFYAISEEHSGRQYDSAGELLQAINRGLITGEKELDRSGPEDLGSGSYRYTVKLQVNVKYPKGESDPFFTVRMEAPSTVKDGEEIEVRITPARDAYVAVFSVDEDDLVWPLFPNDADKADFVKGGETLVLPTQPMKDNGMAIRGSLPQGKNESSETLRVVCCKNQVKLLENAGAKVKFFDLISKLVEMDKNTWCLGTVVYRIVK